jgi:hypothetical protein
MPAVSKRAEHDELLERSRLDRPPIEVSLVPDVSIRVLIVSSEKDSTGKVEVSTQFLVIEDPFPVVHAPDMPSRGFLRNRR